MKPPLKMLIEKYRNNLYTAAFNVCKSAQDAEDVVQDTFLQYWSQKKEFETEQHIRAWLLRVAINKAKNKNNTFFRRNALPLEDYMETLAFQSEESSELFEAVMKLPEKYRIVTAATIQFDGNGSYRMEYTDGEGHVRHQSGGGVAFAPDGTEIPVSEEDLMAQLAEPDVQYEEDGSVWLHWFDQSLDITDRFEDGVCYVKLVNHGEPLYMTVKYENGYATSSHKYVSPWEFN